VQENWKRYRLVQLGPVLWYGYILLTFFGQMRWAFQMDFVKADSLISLNAFLEKIALGIRRLLWMSDMRAFLKSALSIIASLNQSRLALIVKIRRFHVISSSTLWGRSSFPLAALSTVELLPLASNRLSALYIHLRILFMRGKNCSFCQLLSQLAHLSELCQMYHVCKTEHLQG